MRYNFIIWLTHDRINSKGIRNGEIMDSCNYLKIALSLGYKAGEEIKRIYDEDFNVDYKDDNSPVTNADIAAHNIIVDGIKTNFPNHAILSEESAKTFDRGDSMYCWIIDPLDGTKEFIKKNDEFTVNIALTYKNEIIMSVVYAPMFDEMYYALKNKGAWCKIGEDVNKIYVSDRKDKLNVLISRSPQSSKSKAYIQNNIDRINSKTAMGSSLKGCRIARGDYDVYYNCGRSMIWDTCAVELIVREAGGVMGQLNMIDIPYDLSRLVNDGGFYILNTHYNHFKWED